MSDTDHQIFSDIFRYLGGNWINAYKVLVWEWIMHYLWKWILHDCMQRLSLWSKWNDQLLKVIVDEVSVMKVDSIMELMEHFRRHIEYHFVYLLDLYGWAAANLHPPQSEDFCFACQKNIKQYDKWSRMKTLYRENIMIIPRTMVKTTQVETKSLADEERLLIDL